MSFYKRTLYHTHNKNIGKHKQKWIWEADSCAMCHYHVYRHYFEAVWCFSQLLGCSILCEQFFVFSFGLWTTDKTQIYVRSKILSEIIPLTFLFSFIHIHWYGVWFVFLIRFRVCSVNGILVFLFVIFEMYMFC